MSEKGVLSGHLDWGFREIGLPKGEVEHLVREYDPQNEVVLLIQRPSGKQDCLRVSTPTGHLPPPAATEEAYRACEESYGACEESFDVFQSLMEDPNSEQDQHPTVELPAGLKAQCRTFSVRYALTSWPSRDGDSSWMNCVHMLLGGTCVLTESFFSRR